MNSTPASRSRVGLFIGSIAWVLSACTSPAATPPAATSAPAAAAKPTTAPAAAAPAGAATTAPAAAAAPTGTPIKVGVMDDVTGVGAIEGALMRISTELVVQRTNSSGGINGHPLQVSYVDPKGDANNALQLATQLAQQDNVDVLAGGLFSPECLGVQSLASKLQMVYLPLNGCASDVLSTKMCDKYTFRVYPAGRQTSDPSVGYQ